MSVVTSASKWTFALAVAARLFTQSVNKDYSPQNTLAFAAATSFPVGVYSLLKYPKEFAEFPAFRAALTQFIWAPGAIVVALLSLRMLQSGPPPKIVWSVLQSALVAWPTWWSLAHFAAPVELVSVTRRAMVLVWLVYLSFVSSPVRPSLEPQCLPATRPAPAPAEAENKSDSLENKSDGQEDKSDGQESSEPPRRRQSSLDRSAREHLEAAKDKAFRGSPRPRPRAQKLLADLSNGRKDQLREVFTLFDKSKSGFLTPADFLKIGRALKGLRWTEACNSDKFHKLNTSGSGSLSEAEFLGFFQNAGMGDISDVVFDSYITEYREAARQASPKKAWPSTPN